jgi:predicted AlkP superfamily phosphohydrolase/phosphomutase
MQRVIVIGLDGGTLDLMQPWMDNGSLPNFDKIRKQGSYGKLRSTTPYYSAPAWVSIVTGSNPGKHGIYDFFRTDCFAQKNLINSGYRKKPAIWNLLTEASRKSIVVNVPGTYPPEKINGVIITCLLTPSFESNFTYPKEIKNDLTDDKLGKYELEQIAVDDVPKNLTAKYAPEKLSDQINMITTSHATVTINLMERYNWDFTMVVFRGTDDVQHLLWDRKDLILSCYKKADEYIGKIMNKYPDALLIVVSDHGFGKADKYFYINNALYNAGYIKTTSDPVHNFNTILTVFFSKTSKFLFYIFPMQKIFRTKLGKKLIMSTGIGGNIDFSKTIAVYHSICSRGIRINLKEKYKFGIVEKKDYDKIRNEIIDFLGNIRDPETGEKIVKKIYKYEEIYGENAANDPLDIIFDLKEEYGASELIQPRTGIKAIFKNYGHNLPFVSKPGFYDWVGDHRPNGIIFMYGKNIQSNNRIEASVIDIVPTILSAMDIPISNDIDGRVIEEAFIKKPKIKRVNSEIKKKQLLTEAELKKIRKLRLRL